MADDELSVLTWNVHGLPMHRAPERLARIAGWIGEKRPDVVLLQEVWSRGYSLLLTGSLTSTYEVRQAVHPFSRRPRGGLMILVRRDSGWRPGAARFEAFRSAASWYRLQEGDGVAGKGMLAVDLQRNGRVLAVVNTHLQAQYLQNSYDDVRRAQLVQLAVFLDGAGARHSLIFGGDLNTEAGEALYGTHLAPLGFDLTAETRRNRGGTTCFDRHGGRSEWIDYVFVRGLEGPSRLEKIDSDAPDDPYSDHDGLLLHLSVAGTGSPERLQPT